MRGSFFTGQLGVSMQEYLALPRDRAAALVRGRVPDLLHFLRHGVPGGAREPRRTQKLAASLEAALLEALKPQGLDAQSLRDRIVVDGFVRAQFDRDQNVYLGSFYTRVLTRATPDVLFQPTNPHELEVALAWARKHRIGITTRGAGSTAMGGAVPNDGGLLLEMSRFDHVQVDRKAMVASIGAGARLKQIHAKLAAEGVALKTYPSNLGGTLAGWFCTGGLGLNSFQHGSVQSQVRALSLVLPRGEHVRFHDDGRLDVLEPDPRRLSSAEGEAWLGEHGYPPFHLRDQARTEGQFGVILTLTLDVQPLQRQVPFWFEFETDAEAFACVREIVASARSRDGMPANLKWLSAAHVAAVRRLRGGKARPEKPAVYVDFDDPDAARRFEAGLDAAKWKANRDDVEARRWLEDRFRPQQTKRLGPGFLAAEVLLAAEHAEEFHRCAVRLAGRVGVHLETEIYFLADGRALALPGYLSRGPRPGFLFELLLAPILLDLAMVRFGGTPYVLGRWQSPYFRHQHAASERRRLRDAKKRADRHGILNRGVFFGPVFRLPFAQGFFRSLFPAGVRMLRWSYASPLVAPYFKLVIGAQRGRRAAEAMQRARLMHADRQVVQVGAQIDAWTKAELAHAARGCVNCGECNAVCPVFHDAGIRLPQMLTHLGEGLRDGARLAGTPQLLLDLCMRCGNCQEVCQADIPHLGMYAALERHAGGLDEERRERQVAVLSHLRHSERYLREFLEVRPGGYLQRTPASLPGEVRYVLLRSENDAGPRDTCVHCGACVPVCPTQANLEFQFEADPRRITTVLAKCIGCGTCVEVCPANHGNGGRTLRVMEAPVRDYFDLIEALERRQRDSETKPLAAPEPALQPAGAAADGDEAR